MRVLAIETSKSQASAALLEGGSLVVARQAAAPKQSAERLLPMIAELLAEAGWARTSLERLGVSVGPGSFTGLRVGIACAQGLALGLNVPLVGVTSLAAMARCVPEAMPGVRCAVLDARRDEVFIGAYTTGGRFSERLAPAAFPIATARADVERIVTGPLVWIGAGLGLLGVEEGFASEGTREPGALGVGLLAGELSPSAHPATPVYVRDAGATLPNLGAPTPY